MRCELLTASRGDVCGYFEGGGEMIKNVPLGGGDGGSGPYFL